ncbi:CusA/CzcA family heavy metal efflux RND transporter [Membranicola marinus]|uniref:CusA/CzcA family heavy metal efflux RND transporter n=1 Tax=Membranihabitans marinus TaxID=1227546 RepID=A0A953HTP7_9BACT|nr:CusA/CzcA family heavy metal efflux RND transporter [Membranihabitans marinus]MBY5958041.1 CusA/CzcA family heavy metal efflux RND transporter [Membranihabitans marinus]
MLDKIIHFSIHNKVLILLFTALLTGFGVYSLFNIPVGAVPDITNNQVQVITTSRNLSTQDVEQFLTYPVELEMANLPNVKEIRSISKFGLSVVTIVFDDHVGTYLPRQLIAEKLKSAEEKIPDGFGVPFMGPITTGLGEIYQYTLEVDSAHQEKYSLTDLRTIQDWIVKRQLSGIPGVVEVNTWGGYLKQYEVAVNPERLRALQIPVTEIFDALEKNNSVAGGGYIEKTNESYFIRGEGLANSLDDIENIVVTIRDGKPIFIRDVGTVGFGHANRFGAITGNGEGEKVLGQVMLLKGANVEDVIGRVVDRVESIQSSLPEGVYINAFLERTELIGKTTFTIAENLILGFLIVVFVVVLLLGNLRSGLVVGSVIPLSLLFALSMMYILGIDANLMSLGAIDFGIIIDGAVIIVEFIAFQMTQQSGKLQGLTGGEKRSMIDKITHESASKMMRSAIFGQIIIIIVFIPILSLTGVEGKMFGPMAMVFSLALAGTMILGLTYVPVMASLFLKPSKKNSNNISHRLIRGLENLYHPVIVWALRMKWLVLLLAVGLLGLTVFLFSKMGGEFVPTLDEGDLVIQPILKTGTSLTKTIETTTQIEKILLTFPEVEQVVTRIGAAEVPTDPMSMEETDVIVKLTPIKTWTTAGTKVDLIDEFQDKLSVIPGVEYEFTQPIEMRFNELITGVRADLAVKIFGEDLDVLHRKAVEVENAIRDVDGASDIITEKTVGLPQMSVEFDRAKIARYGLNIAQLNDILTMAFAGKAAGTIFEGERQFDLVVRLEEGYRKDLADLEKTTVQLPNGQAVPFTEFASIQYTTGPAMISRDDTRRRIVVGVNVRDRDLESVVNDVQNIIAEEIDMPPGYTVEYGGQFENLRSARQRLTIVIPIALILIFFLLYFAFHSVRDALLIYTAIPLSAVGGVMLLFIRDMPFSISASIGFIALFGVAVLNGIVLIEHFKELKSQGMTDIHRRIILGTKHRMRPVLLTASAAAMGFLPMAISTNVGAEVQRPLATVVIGGLISATILTLLVLPVLYAMVESRSAQRALKKAPMTILLLILGTIGLTAQNDPISISLDDAISLALENNQGIQASSGRINQNKVLENSAFDVEKTEVYYNFDQSNLAENGFPLHVWGVNQSFEFPTIYKARRQVLESNTLLSRDQLAIRKRMLTKEVSQAYYAVLYWNKIETHYKRLDSLYGRFVRAATRRYESGETNRLVQVTAENKQQEVHLLLMQSRANEQQALVSLRKWLQTSDSVTIQDQELIPLNLQPLDTMNHPGLSFYINQQVQADNQLEYQRRLQWPDIHLGIFQGLNGQEAPNSYLGFQIGLGIPLFNGAQKSRIEAARVERIIRQHESFNYKKNLRNDYQSILRKLQSLRQGIDYYENTGQSYALEILSNAQALFESGEIDFLQYIQLMDQAQQIERKYLDHVYRYNQAVLEANYLIE